jgi:LPXTG-site transpeptidase (sortase) family protein
MKTLLRKGILLPLLLVLLAGCAVQDRQPVISFGMTATSENTLHESVFRNGEGISGTWYAVPMRAPAIPPIPRFIVIPSIGVKAPLVPVGLEPSGIMASPAQAHVVGWYQLGPRPGASSNAILAGHIDWYGKEGAFKNLNKVQPGDVVQILTEEGFYRYEVQSLQVYPDHQAPIDKIFAPTDDPQLTLITCAGQYNFRTGTYPDRLVVVAKALPGIYYENGKPVRSHYFTYQQIRQEKNNPRHPLPPSRRHSILVSMHSEKVPESDMVSMVAFLQALPSFYDNLKIVTSGLANISQLQQGAFQNPQATLSTMQNNLSRVQHALDDMAPVVGPIIQRMDILQRFPGVEAPPADEVKALWTFINAAVDMSYELVSATELALDSMNAGERFSALLDNLSPMERHLAGARYNLLVADTARERLGDLTWLPRDYIPSVETSLAQWDRYAERLGEALPQSLTLLRVMPLLLGRDRPVTYLILLENQDELRANGGFIAGVALITLKYGRIVNIDGARVTDMEVTAPWVPQSGYTGPRIQPPYPLRRYMNLGHWMLRDATWWADYPASARQVLAFWEAKTGTRPDVVVTINENTVIQLLRLLGSITLPDGTKITPDNFKQVVIQRIYTGKNAERSRRQAIFTNELAQALLNRLMTSDMATLFGLLQALQTSSLQDEILVYGLHPQLSTWLASLNLDGHLLNDISDDYWYLVESNVSYNKLSPFIHHEMSYQVQLDEQANPLVSQLSVRVTNTFRMDARKAAYPDFYYRGAWWNPQTEKPEQVDTPGYYGGYTRLYLAPESIFLETDGYADVLPPKQEGEHVGVGGYVGLSPEESRELSFTWAPETQYKDDGHFTLVVQRQPGAPINPLRVTVQLPTGTCAQTFQPALSMPVICAPDMVTWQTHLSQTRFFSLDLITKDQLTP